MKGHLLRREKLKGAHLQDKIGNSFFDMCHLIDVHQISKLLLWSGVTNLGNSYTDKALQAMRSSRTEFLDLQSIMAKGGHVSY